MHRHSEKKFYFFLCFMSYEERKSSTQRYWVILGWDKHGIYLIAVLSPVPSK